MEYSSTIKENEIKPSAATWMDLEMIILNEISQTEKGKCHMMSLPCGIEKNDTNELINTTETDIENNVMVTRRVTEGGINQEFGIIRYTHYYTQKR